MDAYVMVLQAIEPQITLRGTDRFWRPAAQFGSARGVILFPDIKIVSTFAKAEAPGGLRTTGTSSCWLAEQGALSPPSHSNRTSGQQYRSHGRVFIIAK